MNKEKLIEILQDRSQEAINSDLYEDQEKNISSKYINKFKIRRRADKQRFLLFIIVLILLPLSIFLAFNQYKYSNSYIDKTSITFSALAVEEQDKYVLRSDIEQYQEKLETRDNTYIKQLEERETLLKEKIVTLEKKNSDLEKNILKVDNVEINKAKLKKYNAVGCYDEIAGNNSINGQCKNKIAKFLQKNKKALKFEVIAVSDTKDKSFIKDKINQIESSKVEKKSIEKFLTQGLARTRVLEAAWLIKNELGNKVLITYVNYIAQTSKQRGVTIRAYYK